MNFDYGLFLGFPLSEAYQVQLNNLSLEVRSLFIQDHPDYLKQIDYQGISYLGRSIGNIVEFSSLELLQANIYSLLRRLVVHYPYENTPLILIATQA